MKSKRRQIRVNRAPATPDGKVGRPAATAEQKETENPQPAEQPGTREKAAARALEEAFAKVKNAVPAFGLGLEQVVAQVQKKHGLRETGRLDEKTAAHIKEIVQILRERTTRDRKPKTPTAPARPATRPQREEFKVQGQVRLQNGAKDGTPGVPAAGLLVRAYNKDLFREEPLGLGASRLGVLTDKEGRYEILYTAKQFGRAEKKSADLIVRVFQPDKKRPANLPRNNKTPALAVSDTVFNAKAVETVDLIVEGRQRPAPSEFERYMAEITPLLEDKGLADIKEKEAPEAVRFLTGETQIPALHIVFLVLAHRHSQETNISPEAFYGPFRQGQPTHLPVFLLRPRRVLKEALERSVAEKIVSAKLKREIDQIVAAVEALRGSRLFREKDKPEFPLRNLLEGSGASPEAQEAFVTRILEHDGSGKEFWEALRRDPLFQHDGLVHDIEFALRMHLLTGGNRSLVKALQGRRRNGGLRTNRDLIRLTVKNWELLISSSSKGSKPELPPDIPGKTRRQKLNKYAQVLVETMQKVFPTAHVAEGVARRPSVDGALVGKLLEGNPGFDPRKPLAATFRWGRLKGAKKKKAAVALEAVRRELRMFPDLAKRDYRSALTQGKDWNPIRRDLSRFFDNTPDFDFRNVRISEFVAKNAGAMQGVKDKAATVTQLKRMQRVLLVGASRYDQLEALMGEGFHSAAAIAAKPLSGFVRNMGRRLGDGQTAKYIHAAAEKKTAVTMTLTAAYHQNYYDHAIDAVGGNKEKALEEVPSLGELFGPVDFCECGHCRSVYGPAAYFVDLLQFLRKDTLKAFNLLSSLRPDLQHIKLTCENTETPLPAVDLVNEILESYIALKGKLDKTTANNTEDISAEELEVNPQYVITAAYDELKTKVHSFMLPFDRPIEVARGYLEHLGSSRYQFMATFQSHGKPKDPAHPEGEVVEDSQEPTARVLASEYLKLSPEEYAIVVAEPLPSGISPEAREFFGYPLGASSSWREDLGRVPEFLRRTGVAFSDLVDLLKTRFINPVQTEPLPNELLVLSAPDGVCDLEQTVIRRLAGPSKLSQEEWLRIHRFLRLWKKLGWSLAEVDAASWSLHSKDIDGPLIENLAHIQWLKTTLEVAVAPLLSLWSNLDTFDPGGLRQSHYDKLFRNRAVINDPLDKTFDLDPLTGELADPSQYLSSQTAALRAALRVTDDDLTLLREATGLDGPSILMTLKSLSCLYGHSFLARALQLKVQDYVSLLTLARVDRELPFTPGSAVEFVVRARRVQESGVSPALLDYLFRHITSTSQSLAPDEEAVLSLLQKIREDLCKILDQTALVPDPDGNLLREKLGLALDPARLDQAVKLINGESPMSVSEQIAFVEQNFAGFLPLAEATKLVNLSAQERRDRIYPLLLAYLRESLSRSLVKQTLADALKVEPATAKLLLEKTVKSVDANANLAYSIVASAPSPVASGTSLSVATGEGAKFPAVPFNCTVWAANELPTFDNSEIIRVTNVSVDTLTIMRAQEGTSARSIVVGDQIANTIAAKTALMDFLALVGDGLNAQYFDDKDFSGNTVLAVEPGVNAFWDKNHLPQSPLTIETFSVVWTGRIVPEHDEAYTLYVLAKDGVQVSFDGQIVIDDLTEPSKPIEKPLEHRWTSPEPLQAGRPYDLKIRYTKTDKKVEAIGLAQLSWSSVSTPKGVIPRSQLYSGAAYVPLEGLLLTYKRLHKAALLVNELNLRAEEVAYLTEHGTDFDGFDPNGWPMERSDPEQVDGAAPSLFKQWEAVQAFAALRDKLPSGETTLLDVLSSANASEAAQRLATLAEWDPADAASLTLDLGLPDALFKIAAAPTRLKAAFDLASRLGVSVGKLREWAIHNPDETQAQEIVQSVKAKYDDETWRAAAKPLNDALREKQRDALIAYLLADSQIVKANIQDADGLFEHFLIDVSLCACMMTSRIKQAISSVQLFIQRCFLNLYLKEGLTPDMLDENRWKWMRNYRVWEANRKVFLYPENWIEPELRDDKTPFFRDLETQLLQNELSDVTVERALMGYLEKLDEVGRLDILGVYRHTEGSGEDKTDEVHIFGRTRNEPAVYYYRKYIVRTGVWTPWEKINVDIDSRHLIPVVWNRRLYLFWANFVDKPDPDQDLSGPALVKTEQQLTYDQWEKDQAAYEKASSVWEQGLAAYQQATEAVYSALGIGPDDPEHAFSVVPNFEDLVPKPQKPKGPPPKSAPPEAKPPAMLWEIKLAWSEYREDRWSPKRSTQKALMSKSVTMNGQHRPPEIQDHIFTSVVKDSTELSIWCHYRYEFASDTPHDDLLVYVGSFNSNGCGSEMKIEPTTATLFQLRITPEGSRMSFVRFDQKSGKTLTFYDPTLKQFPVLGNTPTRYELVHPPYSIEPQLGGFAKAVYPFAYQDAHRTYLALPTVGEPHVESILFPNPHIGFGIVEDDALASEFKYIEKGDPATGSTQIFARSKVLGIAGAQAKPIHT